MPELPDVDVYVETIAARTAGKTLLGVRVANPFVVRTFEPRIADLGGHRVTGVRRLGKRVVLALDRDLFVAVHLMVAGRFRWREPAAKVPGRLGLAAFDFEGGALILTEAGTKRRAAIHVFRGEAALASLDAGGIEPLVASAAQFRAALTRENHTLKRSLTDPHVFAGIGNAYSDEILHRARLSPVRLSQKLDEETTARLHRATQVVLTEWRERLRAEAKGEVPEKVTAFHEGMAVHGRFGKPCPVCGAPVQRIRYAENEANYCAPCQTEGKLLADRGLSRLLRGDWPKSLDDLEERKRQSKI